MKRISTDFVGAAVLSAALLVACGGGGGSSGSAVPGAPPPVATNPPVGSPQSFSATDAVAIPTAAPGAATLAVPLTSDPSGASANAALSSSGSIPPDATVASTYSTAADSTLPALAHGRSVQGRTVREDSKRDVIAYLKLQFSADVTLPQAPAFSFVVPRTLPTAGVTYWLAFLDPLRSAAGWQVGFEGPATVTATTANGKAGTQLAFASNGRPISFTANQTYYFAVFGVSATAASPTPVPSSVPTNAPHDTKPASVGVTPRNLQFASVTSSPAPVTFVQQGFTGAFTLHGDCTGIVNTSGTSPTFTVTPIGPGRCVIVGLGDRGASAVVHIGVVTPFETAHPSPSPEASHSPEPTHAPSTAPSSEPSHSPEPTHAPSTAPSSEPTHPPATASATPQPTAAPSEPPH
ncbi:MAG: hypothetical protein M3169_05665 [Candidatus Eremiobacteraeota bacterium]|nr:hypothetical protein [Candidatus Eremiobacteraeota bacterium]